MGNRRSRQLCLGSGIRQRCLRGVVRGSGGERGGGTKYVRCNSKIGAKGGHVGGLSLMRAELGRLRLKKAPM